ncbi:MAG: hypothetical protein ACOCM8_09215 [Acetivibrio ethanolgignens]
MFLLSLLGVILVFTLSVMYSGIRWEYFVDLISIFVLLVVSISVLVQTGLMKDFNNSFRLTIGRKKAADFKEIKRAAEAVNLIRKILWNTGIFTACISLFTLMHDLDTPEAIGPNLVAAILVLSYAAVLNIIFLPIEKQLEIRLIEFDGEE